MVPDILKDYGVLILSKQMWKKGWQQRSVMIVVSGWWLAGERGESMLGACGRGLGAPSDTASHHRRYESDCSLGATDMILLVQKSPVRN